jgi:hypothetical protein
MVMRLVDAGTREREFVKKKLAALRMPERVEYALDNWEYDETTDEIVLRTDDPGRKEYARWEVKINGKRDWTRECT